MDYWSSLLHSKCRRGYALEEKLKELTFLHYKKTGLKPHFKNAVVALKNVAISQFGLWLRFL